MTENDIIILRGLVAWCENKRIDQVLGKWSAVVDVNSFNQVDVLLVFELSLRGDNDMGIYPELDDLPAEALHSEFEGPDPNEPAEALYSKFEGPDPNENKPGYVQGNATFYEEVAYLIIRKGEAGYRYLLSKLASADTPRLRAILFGLSTAADHKQEVISILTRFLEDGNDLIVSEAIEGLMEIGDKASYDRVTAFRDHPSPYVRGSVLCYLAAIDGAEAITTLKAALADPHPIVRQSAINEIDEREMIKLVRREIEHLILNDPDQDVRDAAKTAIE